jgi:hypothetical protein
MVPVGRGHLLGYAQHATRTSRDGVKPKLGSREGAKDREGAKRDVFAVSGVLP